MRTIFCRGCGVQIHEEAPTCPHCGAPQAPKATSSEGEVGSPWIAWTALPFSLLALGSLFADDSFSRDEIVGGCVAGVIAVTLPIISLAQKRPGKTIAIVALVTGLIGLLAAVGHLN